MQRQQRTHSRRLIRGLIGTGTGLREQMKLVRIVAPRETTILIVGESGTGKDVLAREIHSRSRRSSGPFVPVDCTALTASILESQLFGHEKGAFTGAVSDSLGLIRCAQNGTLFLDEIGDLGAELQAKFLRVLQDHNVRPVGSSELFPVDFRVIIATHRDLQAMVREGTFREDLYFRLAVVSVELPPLRARPEDIVPLAYHFLDTLADFYGEGQVTLSRLACDRLLAYGWPGNIRELANVMERAYVLSLGRRIKASALPPSLQAAVGPVSTQPTPTLAEVERKSILEALRNAHSVKTRAATLLDIDPRRLDRLISRLGINP